MKASDYLSNEERHYFTSQNNWLAARMLVSNWLMVIGAFVLVYFWTNPLSIAFAMLVIAGRLLGIGVIMHECGHNSFFATQGLNSFFGQWFAAKPVFDNLGEYARGHLKHHRYAGTADDTDLGNYSAYPVDKAGFKRKILRDITGQTGFRFIGQRVSAAAGIFSASAETRAVAKPYVSIWLTQLAMIAVLHFTLSAWLYLLWIGSTMTLYMVFARLRQVAEHAAVPDALNRDPRMNTRTTYANLLERLTVAPNYVNFHLEQHFMAAVPAYRLREFHQLLQSRGAYQQTRLFGSYLDVIRHVTTKPVITTPATGMV